MSVRELVPTAVAALAPVEAGVAVLTGASVPPGAEVLAPVEADPLVEELILSEVEPLARELAQERELAAVGVHQAARVELAQEQAPIAQGLP